MNTVAVPQLNKVSDSAILSSMANDFWALCQGENDRGKQIDTKALSLLGMASVAATLVAIPSATLQSLAPIILIARSLSLCLFAIAVVACVYCARARTYGGFLEEDIFASLTAHEKPVGDIPPFSDTDQALCFLRETILQRWLIYRKWSTTNDTKYRLLRWAQGFAMSAVICLVVYTILYSFAA